MTIKAPDMQPVRWYKPGMTPDYQSYFPNLDNVHAREKWMGDYYKTDYYTDWLINKLMSIQLRIVTTGDEDLTIYKYNPSTEVFEAYDTITPSNITPTGWVSEQINKYDYTYTEEGVYYLDSSTAGYRTDKFAVHEKEKFRKRLLEIVYYNTENDYGMVFFDGAIQRYTGRAYFTGIIAPETPSNEISAFQTDRGNMRKQRATPIPVMTLVISDIHYAEIKRINMILSCNRLTINGITFQNNEAPELERIEETDLIKASIKIQQTDYEYFTS